MIIPISETVIPVGFKREVIQVPHKHYDNQRQDMIAFVTLAGISLVILVMYLVTRSRHRES